MSVWSWKQHSTNNIAMGCARMLMESIGIRWRHPTMKWSSCNADARAKKSCTRVRLFLLYAFVHLCFLAVLRAESSEASQAELLVLSMLSHFCFQFPCYLTLHIATWCYLIPAQQHYRCLHDGIPLALRFSFRWFLAMQCLSHIVAAYGSMDYFRNWPRCA